MEETVFTTPTFVENSLVTVNLFIFWLIPRHFTEFSRTDLSIFLLMCVWSVLGNSTLETLLSQLTFISSRFKLVNHQ